MDKNTQQPVAWIEACDLDYAATSGRSAVVIYGTHPGYECVPLYPAQPVPRDVLMAFGEAVWSHGRHACRMPDLAAIADRYASQVQPEPVNQQLLAALKSLVDMDVAYQRGPKVEQAVEVARAAIAAAEAAQPVERRQGDGNE